MSIVAQSTPESAGRETGDLVYRVRQLITTAVVNGQRRPGRPAIARQLGISEYQVRRALATVSRQDESAGHAGQDTPPPHHPADEGRPIPEKDQGPKGPIHRAWLALLALPAFVAVWGGWVGLGELAGFGTVALLPGIADSFRVNLAVALPMGMEVYAVIGLRVWLSHRTRSARTRRFAMWSSVTALAVGCFGQVLYHVLTSAGVERAPWMVVVFVACLPVAILGAGAALFHLTGEDARDGELR